MADEKKHSLCLPEYRLTVPFRLLEGLPSRARHRLFAAQTFTSCFMTPYRLRPAPLSYSHSNRMAFLLSTVPLSRVRDRPGVGRADLNREPGLDRRPSDRSGPSPQLTSAHLSCIASPPQYLLSASIRRVLYVRTIRLVSCSRPPRRMPPKLAVELMTLADLRHPSRFSLHPSRPSTRYSHIHKIRQDVTSLPLPLVRRPGVERDVRRDRRVGEEGSGACVR